MWENEGGSQDNGGGELSPTYTHRQGAIGGTVVAYFAWWQSLHSKRKSSLGVQCLGSKSNSAIVKSAGLGGCVSISHH